MVEIADGFRNDSTSGVRLDLNYISTGVCFQYITC